MKITKEQVKALAYKTYNKITTSWKTARHKYVEDNRDSILPQVEIARKLLDMNPFISNMRCRIIEGLYLTIERIPVQDFLKRNEVTTYFEDRFKEQYRPIRIEDVEAEIMIATIKAENLETLQGMLDSKFNTDYATFNMDYTTESL